MKRAVIFSRVSTKNQSTNRQIENLKKYAKREKLKVLKIYDETISGALAKQDRVVFLEFLKYVIANKVDIVLVEELSRISRRLKDLVDIVYTLQENGINLYVKNKGLTLLEENGKFNQEMLTIILILSTYAEQERDNIIERTTDGIVKASKKRGYWGRIAYGFRKTKRRGELIVDEEEAKIVQQIFEMYLLDYGTRNIAKYLTSNNIPTKFQQYTKKAMVKRKGGPPVHKDTMNWNYNTILKMLRNERYKFVIIDDITFEKVKQKLTNNWGVRTKTKTPNYLYSKIHCGICQRKYYQVVDKSTQIYRCLSKRQINVCDNYGINIHKLNTAVFAVVNSYTILDDHYTSNRSIYEREIDKNKVIITNNNEELAKMDGKKDRFKNMYINNIITLDDLMTENKILIESIEGLNKDVSESTAAIIKYEKMLKSISTDNYTLFEDVEHYKLNAKNIVNYIEITKIDDNSKYRKWYNEKNKCVKIELNVIDNIKMYFILSQRNNTLLLCYENWDVIENSDLEIIKWI